jgi:septal ring factor EnvC (AmiA/AmiB activator)
LEGELYKARKDMNEAIKAKESLESEVRALKQKNADLERGLGESKEQLKGVTQELEDIKK